MTRNLYLAQVNYQYGTNTFLPYSVGRLWAYAKEQPGIADAYSLRELIFLREPVRDVVARMDTPDVVGVSCYIWNWAWALAFAEAVKVSCPGCLIVLGGPQVPERSAGFFAKYPFVDMLIHGEGEIPFAALLTERLKPTWAYFDVPALSFRGINRRTTRTGPAKRADDLAALPSPYLAGVFDDLIARPYDWHASQETNRGCPYSCTFCDWGSAVFQKVRKFPMETIAAEIEWFAEHEIELLYNCDANFGLLKRDRQIAEALVAAKGAHGFPQKFRAAYAKNHNDALFEVAKMLSDADMSKGVTLSFQSMDAPVLEKIKRRNITEYREAISRYDGAAVPVYSELILGLPGETYDSFADGIASLLDAGQHDGINVYPCMVLENSEMAEPAYRALHEIKSVRTPILLLHGSPADPITEHYDIVIATRDMRFDDWRRAFRFAWAVQAFHCLGLTRFVAVAMAREYGVRYREFYESLASIGFHDTMIDDEIDTINALTALLVAGRNWNSTVDGCGDVTWPPEEATFLRCVIAKDRFYRELRDFLAARFFDGLIPPLMRDVLRYQKAVMADPHGARETALSLSTDAHGYFAGEARPGPVNTLIRAPRAYDGDLERFAREVVWYGRKGGRMYYDDIEVVKEVA